MRGEQAYGGLYMKALDIQNQLGIPHIQDKVLDTTGDYEYDEHYVFFDTKSTLNPSTLGPSENTSGKVLYLMYFGVVKLLISSRSPNTRPFQKWVITTLFTH